MRTCYVDGLKSENDNGFLVRIFDRGEIKNEMFIKRKIVHTTVLT